MLDLYLKKNHNKKYLIGLFVGKHDANLCLYDKQNLSYYKLERDTQVKHASFNVEFKQHNKNYKKTLIDILNFLKISKNQIQGIAIGDSNWDISVPNDKYIKLYDYGELCDEVYFIDHHYSHFLSNFDTNQAWVYDGHSNDLRYSTIFKNHSVIQTLKEPENGYSFGRCLEDLGVDLLGSDFLSGHVMALEALGTLNLDYYNQYKNSSLSKSYIYQSFKNFTLNHAKQNLQTNVCNDYVKTLHEIIKNNHLKYLKSFFSKEEKFLFTGGISQSIILNTHLKKHFPNMIVTPHGYDGGISLGLINFLVQTFKWEIPQISNFPFIQSDEFPGEVSMKTIIEAAELLAKGKIVLWYQGQGEIGPRALGNRSILANPSIVDMKEQINLKVKKRAWYRPYGASVLREDYKEHFNLEWDSPYMLYQAEVKNKDVFKSITHFDGTCRIQTVQDNHKVFFELLTRFKKLTGFSVLLNTSLNTPGKPIAGRKKDVLDIFNDTEADVAIIGDEIIRR